MGHRRKFLNQKGFGSIELLLILVIVGLLGFIAWYVAHSKSTTQDSLNNANVISSDQSTPAPIFTFKEFGVKIPLPSELKGLAYEAKTITGSNDQKYTALYVTTDSLHKSINACNGNFAEPVSNASFGALNKTDGKYPATPTMDDGTLLKQFDKFFIGISYPNGLPCVTDTTKNDSIMKTEKDLQKALVEAFKTATEVK